MSDNSLEKRIVNVLKGKKQKPVTAKDIARRLNIRQNRKAQFKEAFARLIAQNRLIQVGGKYVLADNYNLLEGRIVKVNATFGFAAIEGSQDVFIPGRDLLAAMPGDKVLIHLRSNSNGELPEGVVMKITEQAEVKFSGVLHKSEEHWLIVPDAYVRFQLRVNPKTLVGAKVGDKVVARLETRGERHSHHVAAVIQQFGEGESAAACCQAILAANDITPVFSPEAVEQAQAIAALSGIHPKELEQRLDLREEVIFTIDGADSKDLDDAISLKKLEEGWALGVHIADVSYFVTHKTPLDNEAYERGTSVYYADSVVPMLPPELSNGICSLNPNEDRLAFSALMELDRDGKLAKYRFEKTVIRSRVKGVYSEVNAILKNEASQQVLDKYLGLTDTIRLMEELADILTSRRLARGGMELETTESKIKIGPDGKACDISPAKRGKSELIIEEFMLTANQAAAKLAREKELPFVYRVHDDPAPDRVQNLFDVLERLGVDSRRPKDGITTKALSEILDSVRGKPNHRVVNTMVLRSMAKAKYSEKNTGHFGLVMEDYAHFTSPIRRYPDLTIHRILSSYLGGMKKENMYKRYGSFVVRSAQHSTEREIAAMAAERNCEDCYMAEYMKSYIGEEYDGIITGVTGRGIYVELENTVEGFVPASTMEGHWEFDAPIALVEQEGNKQFQLGDPVRIRVEGARVSAGQIDFLLCETGSNATPG